MKKMMKSTLGCLLIGTLSVPVFAFYPGVKSQKNSCPPVELIKNNTVLSVAIEDEGRFFVFSASPLMSGDEIYWVSVGRNVKAKTESDALTLAKDLLSSITGPLSEEPTRYTYPDDGFSVNACQYQTKDVNVIITAVPDDES